MAKTRLIICSDDSGQNEDVFFTDDFDMPASEACCPDQGVTSDTIIDVDLPDGFPMEYSLRRH